ncbi:MAG: hypothetical protein JO171_04275 [Paludibacterium sp.]|uniref:hypothetical protein n=1 Tax=Paludibacterium sp. TaxID=1917523 RepID=UPI0025E36B52|nr:hypothetical protein [Paludibacterium sp.]MBV8046340.1 hypothetical protein [Paludibacterium sp.]MBV8649544.1 hypothetical protein [Paludibacterium sp.]
MSKNEPKKPDPQAWPEMELPILTDVDETLPSEGVDIPEFDFSDELDQMVDTLQTAETPLEFPPELLLEDVGVAPAPETAIDFNRLPSLDLEAVDAGELTAAEAEGSEFEFELEPMAVAQAEAMSVEEDAPALPDTEQQIPELTLEDVLPGPSSEVSLPADAEETETPLTTIPELTLDEVLADDAAQPDAAAMAPAPVADAAIADLPADLPVLDEVWAEDGAQTAPLAQTESVPEADDVSVGNETETMPVQETALDVDVAEAAQSAPMDDLPVLDQALTAAETAPTPESVLEPESAECVMEEAQAAEAEAQPVLATALTDDAAGGMAEAAPASVLDEAVEAVAEASGSPVAEPVEDLDAMAALSPEAAAPTPAELSSAPAEDEPFRSISLDSLPRGVLGGGLGVPESEEGSSVQDLIRAAERTLAQERLKQAMAEAREEALQSALDAPLPVETAPSSPTRPVEIINVAGLASSPAPQAFNLPTVRKSYVTLVDEAMLIDSLYDKILPRMKVELSLWLQDALDHQSKQMLSGVMHQLKEDYEMLFSETLRESLRQAIAEMGREERGERR